MTDRDSIGTAFTCMQAAGACPPARGGAGSRDRELAELRRRLDASLEERLLEAQSALAAEAGVLFLLRTLLGEGSEGEVGAVHRDHLDGEIRLAVEEINGCASQLADLNRRGAAEENAARQRRGDLLRELSERIAIRTVETSRGEVNVLVGGAYLVLGAEHREAAALENADGVHPVFASGGAALPVRGGRLRGLLEARDLLLAGHPGRAERWKAVAAAAQGRMEIQASLARQLEILRTRLSVASIDEESARLIRDQGILHASARRVGVIDELLETLKNGI